MGAQDGLVLDFSMERDNDLVVLLRQFRQTHVYLRDLGEATPEEPTLRAARSGPDSEAALAVGIVPILQHLLPAEMAKLGDDGLRWCAHVIDKVRPLARKPENKWGPIPDELNLHLSQQAWLASKDQDGASIVDLFLYTNLYHLYEKMALKQSMGDLAYLTRFFSRAQTLFTKTGLPAISIDTKAIDDAALHAVKMQLKAASLNGEVGDAAAAAKRSAKKEKKAATNNPTPKTDGGKNQQPAPAAAVEVMEPFRIDLRVGKIVEVSKHPDADALYVEKIDFGEESGPRTIISGLVNHMTLEEMKDRWVVCMCNLKPVSMRGIKSEGMVMCATSAEGKVAPLRVPVDSQVGDKVTFRDYPTGEPDAVLNPKKKVWETLKPFFKTDGTKTATFDREGKKGVMETSRGPIYSDFAVDAPIS